MPDATDDHTETDSDREVDRKAAPPDPKEQMRAALERKKQGQRDASVTGRGKDASGARPDTHPHGGKREFRRKSG